MKATLEPVDRRTAIEPSKREVATQPRSFSVDCLRSYATMQVLLIHASIPFIAFLHAKNPWWAACDIDAASRSAVPLFFMISGMLLLEPNAGKHESIPIFLKRRFTKVVVPLIVWSLVYIVLRRLHNPDAVKLADLNKILSVPASYQLGFLFQLSGLYLATPILRVFIRHASRAEVKYLVGLWLTSECVIPVIRTYCGWTPPIIFQLATGSVGIFVLGYLLRDCRIEKKYIGWAFLALASCVACNVIGTYVLTEASPIKYINQTFFDYNHPLVVIYSAVTFVLLRSLTVKLPAKVERHGRALISSFAAASFTIYLIHPLYLEHLQTYDHCIYWVPGNKFVITFIGICLLATITGAIGWLFYILSKKLRLPTWLVP